MGRNASLNAKSRPLLTEDETKDAKATVAMVLCATGALQRGTLTFGDWKECFRAVRGKDCLRIDRKAKNKSKIVRIDSMTPEQLAVIEVAEEMPGLCQAKRNVIARRIRHLRACISAALSLSTSRKIKALRKTAVRNLRFVSSQYQNTGRGFSEIVTSGANLSKTVSKCMLTFQKQIEDGEKILTAQAMDGIPFAKARTLKTFAELR
jgi:hypothetical protein